MTIINTDDGKTKRMRSLARSLSLVWACWWIFFALVNAIGEQFSRQAVLALLLFPLLFLGCATLPRFSERTGGMVLLLEGLIILVGYTWITYSKMPFSTMVAVLLMLALPPLISGLLFLVTGWRKSRTSEIAQQN